MDSAVNDTGEMHVNSINIMISSVNDTVQKCIKRDPNNIYSIGVPVMMVVGLAAIIINGRCLIAIRWLRGTLTPTLLLSLSLAAADLYTSVLWILALVLNSYLPSVWCIHLNIQIRCVVCGMEGLRLTGVITIIGHLTALAINHHLGIVRPLRYPGIATRKNIRILLYIIWIFPPLVFLLYIFIPDGFEDNCLKNMVFIIYFSSHLIFSLFLILPLILMCFIYIHILWVVHLQTRTWARGSVTGGSQKHSGGSCRKQIRQRRPSDIGCVSGARQRLMVNVRAVYTTLYILGSFIIFYLPAVVMFLLVCDRGCRWGTQELARAQWLNYVVQLLVIVKPLTNPIIYAARMNEIKEATRRMEASLRWVWCGGIGVGAVGNNGWSGGPNPAGPEFSGTNGTRTALCRFASNGSSQPQIMATLIVNNDTTVL